MNQKGSFIITFISYSFLQGSRSMWSYMQKYIVDKESIGLINLTFLISYGISMNRITPQLCCKNLKGCLLCGVLLTGVIMFVITILSSFKTPIIIVVMVINGFGQSLCYPSCANIMGNWFKSNIGFVMGVWMGCSNLGSIFSLMIGDLIVQRLELSPSYGFLIMGLLLVICALVIKLYLQSEPKYNNLEIELIEINQQQSEELTKFNVWEIRGIIYFIICYSCLKGTSNGFTYWLPFYFQTKSQQFEQNASNLNSLLDIGLYFGGIIIGRFGDVTQNRVLLFVPCLALSILTMTGIIFNQSLFLFYFLMLGLGFFHGGPLNNISGALIIELAEKLSGNRTAISSISSTIESIGSLTGASFQLILQFVDIDHIFIFFTLVTLVAELQCIMIIKNQSY